MRPLMKNQPAIDFNQNTVHQELSNIAQWWCQNGLDEVNGGFVGEISYLGNKLYDANKGIILNSSILWFFSEASLYTGNQEYRQVAERAFDFIVSNFHDESYGGAFWELDANGKVVNHRKQTYAQCFCIYAFCAYYKLTQSEVAKSLAMRYFALVQAHTLDPDFGGYIEALTEKWEAVSDHRLSPKDLNFPKSMNTHLHVLEAFGALYNTFPSKEVEVALRHVLDVFEFRILDAKSHHLKLFFENDWQDKSQTWSFGHDIEASWLMWEAAEFLGDEEVLARLKPKVVEMARVCLDEAVGSFGQICDDFDFNTRHISQDSEWWVQAEALVGFYNAYQLSGEQAFFDVCQPIWQFIQDYHLDPLHGEWHWYATIPDPKTFDSKSRQKYKVGFWKAPYHNGRAMMELSKRMPKVNGFSGRALVTGFSYHDDLI